MPSVIVIGSGFAGLSAATFMAQAGWQVTVLEKHASPGGRARQLRAAGFTFDMGPSWYWMPDVFERYFAQFGKKTSNYYTLQRLDPSYRIYWSDEITDIPAGLPALKQLLEHWEKGAARKLDDFLAEAAFKYRMGMQRLVYKPGRSLTEMLEWEVIKGMFRLDVFTSVRKHVGKYFRHPKIRQLLEFPILFLGALPENTPALYTLMNHADIAGGTWYPQGGMYAVVEAMNRLAEECGVQFHFEQNVARLPVAEGHIRKVICDKSEFAADVVIATADYQFVETALLEPQYRTYKPHYWQNRHMAPSCLLYYVGLNKRLKNIRHHMLVFDRSFDHHAAEIYVSKKWPEEPLFYVSASSVSDPTAAPAGCENLVFLVPVAAGLSGDTEALRNEYFTRILHRFEQHIGEPLADAIVYKKSFSVSDFVHEYNAFKGNAYGLANTLFQTAFWRPACRSRKVKNLFYAGQLTVPGPGVPPCIISGEVAARQVLKHF